MSIHAERRPQYVSHRTGAILTLVAMLASAAVLALALTGSFGSSDGGGAVAPGVQDAVAGGRALPVGTHAGVRGVPLPGETVSPVVAPRTTEATRGVGVSPVVSPRTSEATRGVQVGGRIGVRGVPLPAAASSAVAPATSPRTTESVDAGQFLKARPGAS